MATSLIDTINSINATPAKKSWLGGNFGGWLSSRANATDYDLKDRKYDLALAYLFLEPVRSPINKYEEAIGNIPIQLVQNTTGNPDDDKVIASTADVGEARHPLIEVFRDHRRTYGTGYFATQVAEFKLYDEVAIEIIRPTDTLQRQMARSMRVARGLKVLRGAALTVEGLRGEIQRFHYNGDDGGSTLDPDDVAYMRGFNPLSDYHGSSDLLAVLDNLNIVRALRKNALRVLRKAHRPDVYAAARDGSSLQQNDIDTIGKAVDAYRQNDSASMLVLTSPLDFQTVAAPDLSDGVPLSEHQEKTIYRVMRVPMALVGDNSTTTYQQRSGEYAEWIKGDVKPLLNKILEYNSENILSQYDLDKTYRLKADLSAFDVITEDEQNRITVQREHLQTGAMTYGDYGKATGINVPDALKDCIYIDGIPVPVSAVPTLYQAKFLAPAQADMAQAEQDSAQADAIADEPQGTDVTDSERLPLSKKITPVRTEYIEGKAAPPQTTFSEVTYNGVTVQASPVQSSDNKNAKFERWVRHDGKERLISWGQPGEQMERDNDEAREAFNSRHSCSEKKDPFSAGFWACWSWQENAPVRSVAIETAHAHADDCGCHDLPHFENRTIDYDAVLSELKTWVRFRKSNKSRTFDPDATRGMIGDSLLDAIATDDNGIIKQAFDDAFDTVQSWQKSIQSTRLDFESDFEDLLARAREDNNNFGRTQWASAMRSIIRRYGNRAYQDGLTDGGVLDPELSDDDLATVNRMIRDNSQYVTDLGNKLFKADGITDKQADIKAPMWYNKTISPFYDAGLAGADANGMYEWVIGNTEQHCSDCLRLNGQRHRMKSWYAKDWLPQSDRLECNGFQCDCRLVKVNAKARGRF